MVKNKNQKNHKSVDQLWIYDLEVVWAKRVTSPYRKSVSLINWGLKTPSLPPFCENRLQYRMQKMGFTKYEAPEFCGSKDTFPQFRLLVPPSTANLLGVSSVSKPWQPVWAQSIPLQMGFVAL